MSLHATLPCNLLQTGTDARRMTDNDFAREISILRACRDANILQFSVSQCRPTSYLYQQYPLPPSPSSPIPLSLFPSPSCPLTLSIC